MVLVPNIINVGILMTNEENVLPSFIVDAEAISTDLNRSTNVIILAKIICHIVVSYELNVK